MGKKKVLHLLQSTQFSGAENMVFEIFDLFKSENLEMAYCSRSGKIDKLLKEQKIKFYPIKKMNIRELSRVIKEYKPDIIHAHDMTASVLASLTIAGNKKVELISHVHGNHENSRKLNLKTLSFLLASIRMKKILWVSDSAYHDYYFKEKLASKSSIFPNVLNKNTINNKLKKDQSEYFYDIVYVGRLEYPKNPERLINVINAIVMKKPDTKVAIIGNGELYSKVKELIKSLKIEDNIDMLGFVNNPIKIMKDSKLMLMTSRYEGTPMCALEAMAVGVPIVSTPTDGLLELVIDGKTGYLADQNAKIVEKVLSILENEELHNVLSCGALNRFDKLNNTEDYKNLLFTYYGKEK